MKKVVCLLTIICLLCGVPVGAFADNRESPSFGWSIFNPFPLGEELKLSNIKTVDGEWKNVTVKLSEAKLDTAGALVVNKSYPFVSPEDQKKLDFVKVKLTCTMQGYSGKDGYINGNMPVTIGGSGTLLGSGSRSITGVDKLVSDSQFPGAFKSVMSKYKVGKKGTIGAWSYKKVSQLNSSKPIIVSGYAYISIYKGTIDDSCVWLSIHKKNSEKRNNLFLTMNKNFFNSTLVDEKGDYTYGDEKSGIIKSNFELKKSTGNAEMGNDFYCLGEKSLETLFLSSFINAYGVDVKSFEEVVNNLKEYAKTNSLTVSEISSGVYSMIGIKPNDGTYVSSYLIDKGSYSTYLVMVSAYREKPALDKLWENYKIANNVDTSGKAAQATSETKPPEINNTYGNDKVGKFTVPMTLQKFVEKGNENGEIDPNLVQFTEGDKTEWIVNLNLFVPDKEITLEDYKNHYVQYFNKTTKLKNKKTFIEYEKMKLVIMNEVSNSKDGWVYLLIEKDGKLYYFSTEWYDSAYKDIQSTAIKSYLLDKGFTEEAVKTLMLDPVFE